MLFFKSWYLYGVLFSRRKLGIRFTIFTDPRAKSHQAVVHLQLHTGVSVRFLSTWKEFSDHITMTTKAVAEAPFKWAMWSPFCSSHLGPCAASAGSHGHFPHSSRLFSGERESRPASPFTWRASGREASGWTKLGRACCRRGRDRSSSSTEWAQTWRLPSWQLILPRSCSRRYAFTSQAFQQAQIQSLQPHLHVAIANIN